MIKIKLNLQRYLCFCLCLLLLVLGTVAPAKTEAAEQGKQKVVRVGWHEDLYNNITLNGERSGYVYEYQQAVASYTGWRYEYVKGDWNELLEMLGKGEIDLMGAVAPTGDRQQKMLFSSMTMGQDKHYLYAKLTDTGISASNFATLNGKRIGMLKGSAQDSIFEAWKKSHGLNIQTLYIVDLDDLNAKLAKNAFDGFISTETPFWGKWGMVAIAKIGETGNYFAINKNRPDLKADIDDAMARIEKDRPFFVQDIYKRYYAEASSVTLSQEEKVWIAQHGAIRIGCLKHDYGMSSLDPKTGKLVGAVNDYVKFAEDCFGTKALSFEILSFDDRNVMRQALKAGSIDMVFHATRNLHAAEQDNVMLSTTAMTLPVAVITDKMNFDENAANVVGIAKENESMKWYVSYNYPNWKVVEYDSLKAAESALASGKVDCFLVKLGQWTHYIQEEKYYSKLLSKAGQTAFVVNAGNNTLLSILNKTLKAMPASMLDSTVAMYENSLRKATILDFLKAYLPYVIVFLAAIALILELLRRAKKAEEKARLADAAKSNFLFNMSHDIRTPMNAIMGYTELMKNELDNPTKLADYQAKIEQAGSLLLSIINNVLDMARIESGKMELDESYAQIDVVNEELNSVFEEEARKKNIKLIYESKINHKHVVVDVTKIKEIFANLISNAIKYTPEGGTVILRDEEMPCNKSGYMRIKSEIVDTGIGMSKEYLPTLFAPFSREHNSTAGKVIGTGLGMPIVKKLIDLMGGSIEVESELGKGTKFTVILEHKLADKVYYEKTQEAAVNTGVLKGKRILLAEDNELNAEIATVLLEGMGLTVDHVEDGVECVGRIEQKPAGTYDLILMDVQMPNMDGYQATEKIRRFADKAKANIPIVAMTANAFEEDRKNALKAGMNEHIAKPIDVATVEKTLAELLK